MSNLNCPVWTALITPFLADGQIDFVSLAALIIEQEKAKNGIVLFGSTGEGLALTLAEKKAILQSISEMSITVPLMIGVGGFQLEEQSAWIKYCQDTSPVAAFLLVTPIYSKPGPIGQTAWFEALMNVAKAPCMLYNIPGRAGVRLYTDVIKNLHQHPQLWAIKESSGNLEEFKAFQKTSTKLAVYSGDDNLAAAHIDLGASGLVSVASNVWPSAVQRYVTLCLQKQNLDFNNWEAAVNALFLSTNPIPVKALLHEKGIIKSSALRLPLSAEDFNNENLKLLLEQDQAINNWWSKHT